MGAPGLGSFLLLAAIWNGVTNAVDVNICASLNTADMGKSVSIYQTNGLCQDHCTPLNYAYAITQVNGCWCSNYTPDKSTQVGLSECSSNCPGYPTEKCGGPGVFGYIILNGALPSGTKGGSIPSSTESTPSVTRIQSSTSTTSIIRTSSIETVTADGTIKTVTILPTETGGPSLTPGDSQGAAAQESGLKTGAVVGIVVGVVGVVLILAVMIVFFYFRRRKQQQQDGYRDDPSVRDSSSGMLGSGRPEMSRTPGSPGSTGNRSSLLPVDPRMDPFQQSLYARTGSRESIGTLRDDHDYSRRIQQPKVLRATNPDPEVD
ncbi:hypothetical protein E4U41_005716 [Claviceps citrina]|nr:hypothetical protein E4U41_005716 [Claviceps citrina]